MPSNSLHPFNSKWIYISQLYCIAKSILEKGNFNPNKQNIYLYMASNKIVYYLSTLFKISQDFQVDVKKGVWLYILNSLSTSTYVYCNEIVMTILCHYILIICSHYHYHYHYNENFSIIIITVSLHHFSIIIIIMTIIMIMTTTLVIILRWL